MTDDLASEFAGAWRLISYTAQTPGGATLYPYSQHPVGQLLYDRAGNMTVQIMDPGRPAFASGDPAISTEREVRAAFAGYLAYFGTYTVDTAAATVTHHPVAALLPNWTGGHLPRRFRFEGQRLILETPPEPRGGLAAVVTLVWERLPSP